MWFQNDERLVQSKIKLKFNPNYVKNSDKGYILEVDVVYSNELQKEHSSLPFLPRKMKIYGCQKVLYNLYDKKNYVIHIRTLKEALGHESTLETGH